MKIIINILFLFLFVLGCASTNTKTSSSLPPLPKIEYKGANLDWNSEDYMIEQMKDVSETIFMISAPESEKILLNLYKDDGTLVGTLYEGKGGMLMTSLAILFKEYDFELTPGDYLLILYGEKGKTLFKLKAV